MIIDSIRISNFGLYKDENFISLNPYGLGNKNITVLSGQNGVGKSTLLEAIHLCLLGSLSIDNRLSETNYERYLFKRSYKGKKDGNFLTAIELVIEFIKSGTPIRYKIKRSWSNNPKNVDEQIFIEENGKQLSELNKKEKNLFLRELIQPGLAKVMFFDGEKLQSLYDENNLTEFIGDSCKYLFGLNFVDLLNTDLNYYVNKLYTLQDSAQSLLEIKKVNEELRNIDVEIIQLEGRKADVNDQLGNLRSKAIKLERQISDQGRWASNTLDNLKRERKQLEVQITTLKKELIEIYSGLGPFIFCRKLLAELKDRLILERDVDRWHQAADLLKVRINELGKQFSDPVFLSSVSLNLESGAKLLSVLQELLLSSPNSLTAGETIYHEMADNDRSKLISWIDDVFDTVAVNTKKKSKGIEECEVRLRTLSKEQSSFSKEDIVISLLKEIQEVNQKIGAQEQNLSSLNRKSEEANKRKEFYSNRLVSLEQRMRIDSNVDERLKLTSRTKLVLEEYGKQLLHKKLNLLKEKVLNKFNLLCRKDSYLDKLSINPQTFEIGLERNNTPIEHAHLSAGEKQLLIISFLWGLRELTNISLPLIIDTPLARLDLDHRKAFVEQFLPAIQPQVILIGTDMELADDVIYGLSPHIAHHYQLAYDDVLQATQLTKIDQTHKEADVHEV